MSIQWKGVMPATLTQFNEDLTIDHGLMADHGKWLVEKGCTAIIPHGSLGEGATLSFEEKLALQKTYVEALDVPIIPGIAALSTKEAIDLAKASQDNGCKGLMVLPPYLYASDWREMKTHMSAVISATELPCILYNNPVAYKTDFTPEQIAELANEHANLESVKESSTDSRRVTGIREVCGDDRLVIGVGVDDCAMEGAAMGAKFWITGVGGQLPEHNVKIWDAATEGRIEEVMELYKWMLPLLRMDTVVKFVQLLKLLQQHVGWGNSLVRPPRLQIVGSELAEAEATIIKALESDPLS